MSVFRTREAEDGFVSQIAPMLALKSEQQNLAVRKYVDEEARRFFASLDQDASHAIFIPYERTIADLDFTKVDMQYFYTTMFTYLDRAKDGRLTMPMLWCITLDRETAPFTLQLLANEDTPSGPRSRRYGMIAINGRTVCYLVHFELQEILNIVRQPS